MYSDQELIFQPNFSDPMFLGESSSMRVKKMKNNRKVMLSANEMLDRYIEKYHPGFINKHIQFLPQYLMFEIFSHFDTKNLIFLARVCKHWYICSRDSILWASPNLSGFKFNSIQQFVTMMDSFFPEGLFERPLPIKHLLFSQKRQLRNISEDYQSFAKFCHVLNRMESLKLPRAGILTTSINDQILHILSSKCENLKNIDLTMHSNITDRGILFLADNCKNLMCLNLDFVNGVSIRTIIHVLKKCSKIRSISSTFCGAQSSLGSRNADVVEFSCHSNKLLVLGIEISDNIKEEDELTILRNLKNVRKLLIRGWLIKYGWKLSELFNRTREKLREVEINFHKKTIISKGAKIQDMPKLQSVRLFSAQLLQRLCLINLPNLKHLHLQQIQSLDEGIVSMGCDNIVDISIKSCGLDNFDLSNFLNKQINKKLEFIDLFSCTGAGTEIIELGKSISNLKVIKIFNCNDMEYLSVSSDSVKDIEIDLCMSLETCSLDVKNCENCVLFKILHEFLPLLSKLKIKSDCLEKLNLERCTNLEEFQCIGKNMKALNLMGCKIINLKEFLIQCPSMKKFAISLPLTTQVMDEEFIDNFSKGAPNLMMLCLDNQAMLTGKEVFSLVRKLKGLKALIIRNCASITQLQVFGNELVGIEISSLENLESIKFQCKKLRKLEIKECPKLNHNDLKSLRRFCPRIASIKVHNKNK